jgi:hypothetical protein
MKTKISGKRPAMFYQHGRRDYGALSGPRVRIFYPDGKTEWCAIQSSSDEYTFVDPPCWLYDDNGKLLKPKRMVQAIAMATIFDTEQGFPEMEFLGEL